ncbi:MAG: T9SS type A sorting domain-containing protein [Bacteroidota bacterium]
MTAKPFSFLCVILLSANLCFGQSVVTTDKLWNNFINYYAFPTPVIGNEQIKFTGDTLINSLIYKRVERSVDEAQLYWSPYGYIRENSDKQIFYKINAADPERMLYDLHVQPHQTLTVFSLTTSVNDYRNLDSITYYVLSTDSILIDQSFYKRIILTFPNDTTYVAEQWIDSIGSMGGILHNWSALVGCDYYSLQCFYIDGTLRYHDPAYPGCSFYTSAGEHKALSTGVTVSPNPVIDLSSMEIHDADDSRSVTVHIYNLFGAKVFTRSGQNRFMIRKSDFSPGMYFYSVTYKDKMVGQGKLIIN